MSLGSGRPQGGSTITQQLVKNLLVGDNLTYERKIREMIVATRLERALGKDDILELYLNFVFLGRGAWGIEMAAAGRGLKPETQTIAQRSGSGPHTDRSQRSPARGCEGTFSSLATEARPTPCISRPSTGRPRSQVSGVRHGFGMLPTSGPTSYLTASGKQMISDDA